MKTHVFAVRLFGNRHTFWYCYIWQQWLLLSPFSKASNSCPFYDLFPLFSETFRSLKLSIFPPNLINAPRTRGTISRRREMDDTTGVEMCPFDSYSLWAKCTYWWMTALTAAHFSLAISHHQKEPWSLFQMPPGCRRLTTYSPLGALLDITIFSSRNGAPCNQWAIYFSPYHNWQLLSAAKISERI